MGSLIVTGLTSLDGYITDDEGDFSWATPDAEFSQAMCRVYNEWAWEVFGPYYDRLSPLACIAAERPTLTLQRFTLRHKGHEVHQVYFSVAQSPIGCRRATQLRTS